MSDAVPAPDPQRTFPGLKVIITEHSVDANNVTGVSAYKLGARLALEMIDTDRFYFKTLSRFDRFVAIHSFVLVTEEEMDELRKAKYETE